MDENIVSELISTVGFPITCVIALAYFAFYMVKKSNENATTTKGGPYAGGGYVKDAGGNQPHNNMPPYLAVYVWKRIG